VSKYRFAGAEAEEAWLTGTAGEISLRNRQSLSKLRMRGPKAGLRWSLALAMVLASFPCRSAGSDFDGSRAFALLEKQCSFGPRYPGSPGHRACLDFLTSELRRYTSAVTHQSFDHRFGLDSMQVAKATNLVARLWPERRRRVLLCAHWDTRPWADEDPDPRNRRKPILGANDGASGVAVLLELARVLQESPPKVGIDIVLFDAEDQGRPGDEDTYAVGSRHFARSLSREERPEAAILLDMVGDRDLNLYVEGYSHRFARSLVEMVWSTAHRLGFAEFIPRVEYYVTDDHVPLLSVGIPAIDVIDFDYPYWHTLEDTPDKCSPASLEKVGRVLLQVIRQW